MTHHTSTGWAPAPRQGLVPLYPYGFGAILGKAFVVLKGNPKVLLLFVVGVQTIAMTLALVIIGGVAMWTFSRAATLSPFSTEFAQVMAGSTAIVIICSLVVSLALVGVTVIAQGVVIAEVGHAALAEKARLGTLWRRVKPAFWRLIGYSLLVSVAVSAAILIVGGLLVWLAIIGTSWSWIVFGIGMFLAIAGGAVLAAWIGTKLYLAPSAIVLEGAGPIRGIARSWTLTRRRFWPTFGVVVLLFLITQFAGALISGVLSFFAPLLGSLLVPLGVGSGGSEGFTALAVLSVLLTVIASVLSFAIASIMTIVTGAGGTLAYIDARMRDEGIDLRMRRYVDAGGNADDPYTFIPGAQPSPYAQQQYQQPYAGQPYAQPYPGQQYQRPYAQQYGSPQYQQQQYAQPSPNVPQGAPAPPQTAPPGDAQPPTHPGNAAQQPAQPGDTAQPPSQPGDATAPQQPQDDPANGPHPPAPPPPAPPT